MSELNIVDIATSAMRAVNATLKIMCSLVIADMPSVLKKEIIRAQIFAREGTFSSAVMFKQGQGGTRGGIVVYVSSQNIASVFGNLGIGSDSSESEIKDACGEFCNVIAGTFKTEISALGFKDVTLTPPTNYFGTIDEDLEIDAVYKYAISFSHGNAGLLMVDIFIEKQSSS
ncbi:MAG: chemotaxis protein CheX [Candidatus Omnitrophota bacterium]